MCNVMGRNHDSGSIYTPLKLIVNECGAMCWQQVPTFWSVREDRAICVRRTCVLLTEQVLRDRIGPGGETMEKWGALGWIRRGHWIGKATYHVSRMNYFQCGRCGKVASAQAVSSRVLWRRDSMARRECVHCAESNQQGGSRCHNQKQVNVYWCDAPVAITTYVMC